MGVLNASHDNAHSSLSSASRLSESRLLICAGVNGEAPTEARGMSIVATNHPRVMFALQPILGHTQPGWIRTVDHPGAVEALWYKALDGPSVDLDRMEGILVHSDRMTVAEQELLRCELDVKDIAGPASIATFFTPQGVEQREHGYVTDEYHRLQHSLPDREAFRWIDLPPIQNKDLVEWLPGRLDEN